MSDHWQNLADKLKTPSPNPIPRKSSAPPEKSLGDTPGNEATPATPPAAKPPTPEASNLKPTPKKSSSWDAISKFLGIGGGSSSESPAKADSGGFGFWGTPSKPTAPASPEKPASLPPSVTPPRIPDEPPASVQDTFGTQGRKRRGKPSLWETPEEAVAAPPSSEANSRSQSDVEPAPSSPRNREPRRDSGRGGGASPTEGQRDARGFTEHSRTREESPTPRREQPRNPDPAREARRDTPAAAPPTRSHSPSPRDSEDAPSDRRGQRRPSRRALASGVEPTTQNVSSAPTNPATFSDPPARPSRDRDPWDLEEPPEIAEAQSVEPSDREASEEPGPRRRRRRGRRGGRGSRTAGERGGSERSEEVTEDGPQPIASSDREPAPRSRPSRSRDAMVEPDRVDWQEELEPAGEAVSGESSRALRKVPTWSDAIAILVEGNMENHRRTPASSGRGPRSRPQDGPRSERPQDGGRRRSDAPRSESPRSESPRSDSPRSESPRSYDRSEDRPARAPAPRSHEPRSGGPRSDAYRDEPSSSIDRPRSEEDRPSEGRRRYDRSRPPRRRPPGDQAPPEPSVD